MKQNVSFSLQWRHNGHNSISNHQPHDCLLNRLFRRRSKKTSKLRITGLCAGNSPGAVNSPHKWPVTLKMFPFDDVIMSFLMQCEKIYVIVNNIFSLANEWTHCVETKWPPFCGHFFQMQLFVWNSYFHQNFIQIYLQASNEQYAIIGLAYGLGPNKPQPLIWTNNGFI